MIEDNGLKEFLPNVKLSQGFLYMTQNQYELAIPYLLECVEGFVLMQNILDIEAPLYYLGQCYSRLGDYNKGIIYIKKAYENAIDTSSFHSQASALIKLGEISQEARSLGLKIDQEPEICFLKAIEISETYYLTKILFDANEALATYYIEEKQLEKAIASVEKLNILENPLFRLSDKLYSRMTIGYLKLSVGEVSKALEILKN